MNRNKNLITNFNSLTIRTSYLSSLVFLFLVFGLPQILYAIDGGSYISFIKGGKKFPLSISGKSAPLIVSSNDFPGVLRVIKELQRDIGIVTGTSPGLSTDIIHASKNIVVVGTIGNSSLIDKLIENKKLDVKNITGKWDTFLIQVIESPFPNVSSALVIAGSNKRGTIYGMYDLSSQIGVSPWYWWADVPVQKHNDLFVLSGRFTSGEPKVKYRGIFINDEAPALTGWAAEKFGGLNNKFYENVFELLLRLKGNYLWPAMWGNNFDDDDSLNQKLADEYGIVMGTSHHEPMMRSWKEWPKYGNGAWNYQSNENFLKGYWKKGIERMKSYESVVTLGMRGDGDEAMSASANTSLLEKIVSDQRKILGEVTGKDVSTIPQVWALYKEVQEYYDKGMRVPDDVTLLLCDDNWGNIRKLPKLSDPPRKGGYGIYYHFDYVGGPRNYKWLNTNQIERVWEQMHLAYEYGAKEIWIVNVGDIKPMEFPISFFLDYAWNPEKITADQLPAYTRQWAEKQFGAKYSREIADIINRYSKYNSRRKPELLSPDTYSLVNYREAETIVADYNELLKKAEKISTALSQEYREAFYQLVLHPVQACANINELYVTAGKNHLYASQGRASTNTLAEKAKELFKQDSAITNYYNKILAGGKWNHMMDQTRIGYTSWQQPDKNIMPDVKDINIPEPADMGVAIEGSEGCWPIEKNAGSLPEFDSQNRQSYYVEIFNRGKNLFDYSISASEPWINIDSKEGKIEKEKRIFISVDWEKAPKGKHQIQITINGAGKNVIVYANVSNLATIAKENRFFESNGYISIEAENYSAKKESKKISWLTIPGLGRTNSSITPVPVTSKSQTIDAECPRVEYNIYLESSGEINVDCYFSPTLNFNGSPEGIRYGISFDDAQPQIMNMTSNSNKADLNYDPIWNKWVANNINIQVSKYKIDKPGNHILKFWMIDPGVVLQKIVIDNGKLKPSYLGPPQSYNGAISTRTIR